MENKTVRKRVVQKSMDALLREVLDVLEADDGKTFAEKKALALDMLEKVVTEPTKRTEASAGNLTVMAEQLRKTFWRYGEEIPVNGILLRNVQEKDRENFLSLRKSYAVMKSMFEHEGLRDSIWREHTEENSLMFSIEQSGEYVGYCGIQDITGKAWEISIELVPDKVRQGIGFTALTAMLNELRDRLWVNDFRIRIEPTNYASQKLFEKLGAVPNGISELWVHDRETLEQMENENQHLITADLLAVAKKFSVQPEQLLSHVLEYTLKWQ